MARLTETQLKRLEERLHDAERESHAAYEAYLKHHNARNSAMHDAQKEGYSPGVKKRLAKYTQAKEMSLATAWKKKLDKCHLIRRKMGQKF